jgi:hypothetical protein
MAARMKIDGFYEIDSMFIMTDLWINIAQLF